MTTVVVESGEPGIPAPGEAPGEAPAEVTSSEAAIAIAAIEGETQVELARIDLQRTELHLEAEAEAREDFAETFNSDLQREIDQWRARAETAEAELESLKGSPPVVVVTSEASILPPSEEPPPSPPPGEGEDAPRAAEESLSSAELPQEQSPPPEPPKRRKSHRWI